MSEFCPRCTSPLETAADPARLCEVCGWFGDQQEVLTTLPKNRPINPVLAASQAIDLYRNVCRQELLAEQLQAAGMGTRADLKKIHVARKHAANALIELFTGLHNKATQAAPPAPARRKLVRVNGIVPWPIDWNDDRRFNATNEPCDMLVGPCACGAWHDDSEPWVQALLVKHNAEIVDG